MPSQDGYIYQDALPRHSVSAGGAVIREDGRLLAIRRADNGEWALPGGVVELDEDRATRCGVKCSRRPASRSNPAS